MESMQIKLGRVKHTNSNLNTWFSDFCEIYLWYLTTAVI